MSEYQYYEFCAVDRPLTAAQQHELRSVSSRADITAWRFANTYNYSDLRGDPLKLLARYFDVFLYVANWGSRRLAFRLPRGLLPEGAHAFTRDEALSIWTTAEHTFVEWRSEDESGGHWEDGEGWISALLALRQELIAGDLRSLYLGWLCGLSDEEEEEEETPAPLPPGDLTQLTPAQEALRTFLRVDPDLMKAAAEDVSQPSLSAPSAPGWDELVTAMTNLPEEEKELWLMRLFEGEDPHLSQRFVQRLLQDIPRHRPTPQAPHRPTAGALLARARGRAAERERQRREAAQRARDAALDALASREESTWKAVHGLIEQRQVAAYDQAVAYLCDLRDLAVRRGEGAGFGVRLRALLAGFSRRPALDQRLQQAGLLG